MLRHVVDMFHSEAIIIQKACMKSGRIVIPGILI